MAPVRAAADTTSQKTITAFTLVRLNRSRSSFRNNLIGMRAGMRASAERPNEVRFISKKLPAVDSHGPRKAAAQIGAGAVSVSTASARADTRIRSTDSCTKTSCGDEIPRVWSVHGGGARPGDANSVAPFPAADFRHERDAARHGPEGARRRPGGEPRAGDPRAPWDDATAVLPAGRRSDPAGTIPVGPGGAAAGTALQFRSLRRDHCGDARLRQVRPQPRNRV